MYRLHRWFCDNCYSCSSRANSNFCTRSLDFGHSTRFSTLLINFCFFFSCVLSLTSCRSTVYFCSLSCHSIYDIRSSYSIHCTCPDASFWASLWANQHSGLLGHLFLNGCPNGTLHHITSFWVDLGFCIAWWSSLCFLAYRIFGNFTQVVSIKAIGIAIKLTLEGINQFAYAQTWFFLSVAVICVITQLNYLNKVAII